jgi:hypothetical protein
MDDVANGAQARGTDVMDNASVTSASSWQFPRERRRIRDAVERQSGRFSTVPPQDQEH